jgi:hypothetical protein
MYGQRNSSTSVSDPAYNRDLRSPVHFCAIDQTAIALETRFNATFTPRLSLETYMQPLLSSQDYGGGKQFCGTSDVRLRAEQWAIAEPRFQSAITARQRCPSVGSGGKARTIYVAWQQTRSDVAPLGISTLRGTAARSLARVPTTSSL